MPSECVETITCSNPNEQSSTSSESSTQPIQTIYNYPINGGIIHYYYYHEMSF